MQKVLTVATLATVALTSQVEGLSDNEFKGIFNQIGERFREKIHELGRDDLNDDVLFSINQFLQPVLSAVKEAAANPQPTTGTLPKSDEGRGGRKGFIDFDDNGFSFSQFLESAKTNQSQIIQLPPKDSQNKGSFSQFLESAYTSQPQISQSPPSQGGSFTKFLESAYTSKPQVLPLAPKTQGGSFTKFLGLEDNNFKAKTTSTKEIYKQKYEDEENGEVKGVISFDSAENELASLGELLKEGRPVHRETNPTPRFRTRQLGRNFAELERQRDFENSADDFFRRR